MKKKKIVKNNIRKRYLYITLFGVIFFLMSFYLLNNNSKLDLLKGLSANIFNINKNNKINKEIINSEINNLNNELNELKKINNIDNILTDKKIINATVIKRSAPYWHDIITINKGKKDGIKKGYAVMNNEGYIGEITIVNNNTSEVRLITNSNISLSAKFIYKDTNYYGIINKYNIVTNELYLENVIGDLNNEIIGMNVMTSGLTGNIPSGLYIGKIKSIKKDKYNLSNKIIIELSNNLNDINIVRVVGQND